MKLPQIKLQVNLFLQSEQSFQTGGPGSLGGAARECWGSVQVWIKTI